MTASALLIAGAVLAALVSRQRRLCAFLALLSVAAAAAVACWGGLSRLLGPGPFQETLPLAVVPGLGASLTIALDELSALFLIIVSGIAFLATLYSTAYMERYQEHHLARYYPVLLLFFVGIIGVVTVRDWFFFLIFWEAMTLLSYFLVIFEKENLVHLRAGLKYLIVTHVATIFMLVAAVVLWHTARPHSFSFTAAGQAMAELAGSAPWALHALLALWFIGFATKAGILPFGDWLPDAYPAAPSGATAAFAGSMTKLGVYGLLRVFVDLMPAEARFQMAWGIAIALFGAGSIFVGTLTALRQDDAKRMMSFHVIGQIGYMFLGVGMGVFLLPTHPGLALAGLLAGVFHLLNHVTYKSLLFFTAGSLELRTSTRDMNRMGALSRVMPATALMAGIGSLAIAGIPPFNGFASKWLIYEVAVVGGIGSPLLLLFGLVAIFISLVTLASFLKFLGGVFLGQPSAQVAPLGDRRQDVPLAMQVPQAALALCCVGFGLFPLWPLRAIFRALQPLTEGLSGASLSGVLGTSALGMSFSPEGPVVGVWHPLAMAAALVVCVLIAYGLMRAAQPVSRVVPVWYGGEMVPADVGHFHPHGLYEPFRRAFERVYLTTGLPRGGYPEGLARVFDVDSWLYGPLVRAGGRLAERVSRSHVGIPQWYLVWQVVGVVVVLTALFLLVR